MGALSTTLSSSSRMRNLFLALLAVSSPWGWVAEPLSLARAAEVFAERSAELPAGSVRAVAIDPQIPLGDCSSEWQWSFPYEARTTVQVICTASPTLSRRLIALRYVIGGQRPGNPLTPASITKRYVVAARDLSIGSILTPENVEVIETPPGDRVFAATLSDPETLVGLSLTRSVRRGEALGRADARAVQVIKRNSLASAWSVFPGGRVSAKLMALQNGKAGEWIMLENLQSGRKLRGQVQTDGTVRIDRGTIPVGATQVTASLVD